MATDSSTDTSDKRGGTGSTLRGLGRGAVRLVLDAFVVTCWVLFLTLLFLETAWPRWVFYVLLLVGVGAYVTLTAAWTGSDDRSR